MGNSKIMRERVLGLVDAVTHGVFVLPGTDDLVKAETFSPPSGDYQTVDDGADYGNGVVQNICRTVSDEQTGNFVLKFRWEDEIIARMICAMMGKANYVFAADTPEVGVTKHAFKLVKVLDPLPLFSLAVDYPTDIRGLPSITFSELLIELADNIFKVTATFTGDIWATQSGSLTLTTQTDRSGCFKLFNDLATPRINQSDDVSDDALDSGDTQLKASNVRVRFTRDILSQEPVQGGAASRSAVTDNGPPEIFLELDYPETETQNIPWLAGHQNATYYKGDLTLVSESNIGATSTPYTFFIQFPRLEIRTAPTHDEATPMPVTTVFKMVQPPTAPNGMTETLPNGYFYNTLPTLGYS